MIGLDILGALNSTFMRGYNNGAAVARKKAKPLPDLKLNLPLHKQGNLERGYQAGFNSVRDAPSAPAPSGGAAIVPANVNKPEAPGAVQTASEPGFFDKAIVGPVQVWHALVAALAIGAAVVGGKLWKRRSAT